MICNRSKACCYYSCKIVTRNATLKNDGVLAQHCKIEFAVLALVSIRQVMPAQKGWPSAFPEQFQVQWRFVN